MSDHRNEKLLQDMLRDAAPGFRQELFKASVCELRRKRHKARSSTVRWAIAAGFVLGAGLLFSSLSHRTIDRGVVSLVSAPATNPALEYPRIEIVASAPLGIALIDNQKYPALVVKNSSLPPIELLGDEELLALFADKSAGLVSNSRGATQFIFFDPKDRASIGQF